MKTPIAFEVKGNKIKPVMWDNGRIFRTLLKALKDLNKMIEEQEKIDKLLDKLPRKEVTF